MKYKWCILLVVICVLAGCQSEKKEVPSEPTGIPLAESNTQLDIKIKSEDYAKQIVSGLWEPMMEEFSKDFANRTTKGQLQASWNAVSTGLTGYKGIDSVTEEQDGENRIVFVIVRYADNEGRRMKFVYNPEEKICDLSFEAVVLDKEKDENETGTYEEKTLAIGKEPYVLQGKLMVPEGKGEFPVVILVSDKDTMDMDGTIGKESNTPLLDLAKGLAKQGIATLRYHKRGYQYSHTIKEEASVYDSLIEDTLYAIDTIYNEGAIDKEQIFLAAMGTAADYLPAIVKRKEKRLSGVVMMAGKPLAYTENYYGQEDKKVVSDAAYFINENSTIPLCILQGESDYETTMEQYEQWKTLLKGRSHVTYHSFEKLNHYFLVANGVEDATDYDEKRSMHTSVAEEIAAWCLG